MSQSTVSCAIRTVSSSLVCHAVAHIVFPTSYESQLRTKQVFMCKYGLPGVIGVIDCTNSTRAACLQQRSEQGQVSDRMDFQSGKNALQVFGPFRWYVTKNVSAFFVACCVLHNIATCHGSNLHLTEEALQDLGKRDAELHEPYEGTGELLAKACERRDTLAAQLLLRVTEAQQKN